MVATSANHDSGSLSLICFGHESTFPATDALFQLTGIPAAGICPSFLPAQEQTALIQQLQLANHTVRSLYELWPSFVTAFVVFANSDMTAINYHSFADKIPHSVWTCRCCTVHGMCVEICTSNPRELLMPWQPRIVSSERGRRDGKACVHIRVYGCDALYDNFLTVASITVPKMRGREHIDVLQVEPYYGDQCCNHSRASPTCKHRHVLEGKFKSACLAGHRPILLTLPQMHIEAHIIGPYIEDSSLVRGLHFQVN